MAIGVGIVRRCGRVSLAMVIGAMLLGVLSLAPAMTVRAASLSVTTCTADDPGGLDTLIATANGNGDASNIITFAVDCPVTSPILVKDPTITKPLTVQGNGEARTVVQAIDPGAPGRGTAGFELGAGGSVTLSGMTIRNDRRGGEGVYAPSGGRVTVTNVTFSNLADGVVGQGYISPLDMTVTNSTFSGNGNVGIENDAGRLTVAGSTFSGNGNYGIATSQGTTTVTNSTIINSTASGLANVDTNSTTTITNSTFSGNGRLGIHNPPGNVMKLTNTILTASGPDGNCNGLGAFTDGGHNLQFGDSSCPFPVGDPKLGPLADNGGPTQTMALLAGSAAIGTGDPTICAAAPVSGKDQRGVARSATRCSIGAYEMAAPTLPPTTTASLSGTQGNAPWYTGAVTVTLSATDNSGGSGIAATSFILDNGAQQTYSAPFPVSGDGVHTLTFWSVDKVNDAEQPKQQAISIDATAPTGVTAAPDRVPDSSGWYNHAIKVAFSGTDATSGIASCTSTTYSGPDSGTASVVGTCTDKAGNTSAPAPFPFKYDATAPTTAANPSGTKGTNGWYTSALSVTLVGNDGTDGSGVAKTEYNLDNAGWATYATAIRITADGSHTLLYRSTDAAGNVETTKSLTVQIDATPPTITAIVTPISTWPPDHKLVDVTVSVSPSDGGSGLAGTFVLLSATASGDPSDIQGFVIGQASTSGQVRANKDEVYTLTYQAMDKAGNTAKVVVTIAVPHDQGSQHREK